MEGRIQPNKENTANFRKPVFDEASRLLVPKQWLRCTPTLTSKSTKISDTETCSHRRFRKISKHSWSGSVYVLPSEPALSSDSVPSH